jgi:hypothetical protein
MQGGRIKLFGTSAARTRAADEPGFPNRIREVRLEKFPDLTLKEFAKLIPKDGHWTKVSNDERGRNDMKLSRLHMYAELLGVRPYELILEPRDVRRLRAKRRTSS